MDICLSHESALEMWRDIDLIDDPTIDVRTAEVRFNRNPLRAPLIMPTRALAVSRLPFGLVGASLPLHVLVGSASVRNRVPDLACHVCSKALPGGSFIHLGNRAYSCTPPLVLAQLAPSISEVRLFCLALEMCGSYVVTRGERGFRSRPQLVDVERLVAYAQKNRGIYGMGAVCKALDHALNGSASPMETAVSALMCLPCRLGGFGLPKPLLNQRIELEGQALSASGGRSYVPDLYWPKQKVALEYDGAEYHSSDAQIAHDQRRRNILASLGITVLVMRKEQLHNEQELILIAQTIARHLGVRFRPRANGWRWLNRDLRRELLSPQA